VALADVQPRNHDLAVGLAIGGDRAELILLDAHADLIVVEQETFDDPNRLMDVALKLGTEGPSWYASR